MGWLTDDDLRGFARDGYLVVRAAVPADLLAAADAEVDELVASEPPGHDGAGSDTTSWSERVARLPKCAELLHASPAGRIAGELVAPHPIDIAFDTIQVATTVPPWSHVPGAPHIDGHRPGVAGPESFTMLAGIPLTDQTAVQSGNLWVWPGSHLVHADLFRDRGTRVLEAVSGHACFLDPPIDFGPGLELQMDRGDLLLSHFLLGHNKGGNTSQTVRRTTYYRLQVPDHAGRWEQTFLDPWTEYPPVRASSSGARPGEG